MSVWELWVLPTNLSIFYFYSKSTNAIFLRLYISVGHKSHFVISLFLKPSKDCYLLKYLKKKISFNWKFVKNWGNRTSVCYIKNKMLTEKFWSHFLQEESINLIPSPHCYKFCSFLKDTNFDTLWGQRAILTHFKTIRQTLLWEIMWG